MVQSKLITLGININDKKDSTPSLVLNVHHKRLNSIIG